MQIREGLDWDQAVKELLQAVDYLRNTGSPKVTYPALGMPSTSQRAHGAEGGGAEGVVRTGVREGGGTGGQGGAGWSRVG